MKKKPKLVIQLQHAEEKLIQLRKAIATCNHDFQISRMRMNSVVTDEGERFYAMAQAKTCKHCGYRQVRYQKDPKAYMPDTWTDKARVGAL